MRFAVILHVFFFLSASAFSAVIYVPDDHPTIQGAIDAAVDGDTIIVRAGKYKETIDFSGKEIVLQSEEGPDKTTIDGRQNGSVVKFVNGEGPGAVLTGFLIKNGNGTRGGYFNDYYGGGIFCDGGSCPLITGNVITENDPEADPENYYGYGGGIACIYDSHAEITGNRIILNDAVSGGGIYLSGSDAVVTDNEISDNSCAYGFGHGGGIYCAADALISGNRITNNEVWDDLGAGGNAGGLYIYKAQPTVSFNLISENFSSMSGGGIAMRDASALVSGNIISWNEAWFDGGGIYCYMGNSCIVNNVIVDNDAGRTGLGDGGGIYSYRSSLVITNNTICRNYTGHKGGGIYCVNPYGGVTTITNSIVRNNLASTNPDNISPGPAPQRVVAYSNVEGGWPGTGNFDADPLFVDAATDDFHLTHSSPCRDSGDDTAPGLPQEDFEGDPRIAGSAADVGSDEFHTHLYQDGVVTPGGSIELKVVGEPGTSPVTVAIGSGIQDPPRPTMFGDLHLAWPLLFRTDLGTIPPEGVLVYPAAVPAFWNAGEEYPSQVLVGPLTDPQSRLTNLLLLTVE